MKVKKKNNNTRHVYAERGGTVEEGGHKEARPRVRLPFPWVRFPSCVWPCQRVPEVRRNLPKIQLKNEDKDKKCHLNQRRTDTGGRKRFDARSCLSAAAQVCLNVQLSSLGLSGFIQREKV